MVLLVRIAAEERARFRDKAASLLFRLVIGDPTLQANRFARILAEPQSPTFRQGIDNPTCSPQFRTVFASKNRRSRRARTSNRLC
jgi:hypothetical protein